MSFSTAPAGPHKDPFLQSPGGRTFLIIWLGQLVSTVGSNLTSFALGVHVYTKTESATLFALSLVAFMIPQIVISPFTGALVDRWDRRKAMILSDTGAGLSTLVVVLLYHTGYLQIWHILLATFLNSTFNTIQWPAWSAVQSQIVPNEHLGRASGMAQIGDAAGQLFAPVIAGALFALIGLGGIALIDFVTFAFAVTTLAVVRVPRPQVSEAGKAAQGSLWAEALFGLKYLLERKPLLILLSYFATVNFCVGMLSALFGPLLLDAHTVGTYGWVSTVVGIGMLGGTLAMSAWGGPQRKIVGVVGFGGLCGLFLMLIGVRLWVPLIAAAGFAAMFTVPIVDACHQAIWQCKVEHDVQGRVFSIRRTIAWATQIPALLLAGPAVDLLFNPLMAASGPLADTAAGALLTLGPGRGAGMAFIANGAFVALVSLLFYAFPIVRNIESLLPDAADNTPPADPVRSDELLLEPVP